MDPRRETVLRSLRTLMAQEARVVWNGKEHWIRKHGLLACDGEVWSVPYTELPVESLEEIAGRGREYLKRRREGMR